MRLLLRIGYQDVLFGKGAPIAEILEVMDGIKMVDREGYGESKRYIVKDDITVEATLINDDSVMLPDSGKNKDYEAFHRIAKERDELVSKVCELEKKLKEIQLAVETKNKTEELAF